jgi:hypothetical protein
VSRASVTAIEPCVRVKSTLLVGSLRALRSRGHGDAYLSKVEPEVVKTISALGVPQWLDIRIAEGHYAACDALRLTVDEMMKVGAVVAPTAASGVQVILHAARTTGATPWTVLDRAPMYWKRMYDGSNLAVSKTGPKDATIAIRRNVLARYAYWRIGLRGIVVELARSLSTTAYARELPSPGLMHDAVTYGLSWV